MGKLLLYLGLTAIVFVIAATTEYEPDSDGKIWFGDKDDCDCDSHD